MMVRGIRAAAMLVLLGAMFPALAISPGEVRKQAELSMLVKGTIDISVDGNVEHYAIEKSDKIPPPVVGIISAQVPRWKFEPVAVDGRPVRARTNMTLRIVATPDGNGNYAVGIQSASFSGGRESGNEKLSVKNKTSLGPLVRAMMTSGATGDVYLALKIGPDGNVMDGIVEQVNLTAGGTEKQMENARKLLGETTLAVIRKWTFNVPTAGKNVDKPYWSGVMPVSFRMSGSGQPSIDAVGRWRAYLPGPCTPIPWRDLNPESGERDHRCGNDSMPDGELTLDNSGPKLLTPLTQG